MKTTWTEIIYALTGALIGLGIPLVLNTQIARVGDNELWGVPLFLFGIPGLFVGAIAGASIARIKQQ